MTVQFRHDLGDLGVLTLETAAEDLVSIHAHPLARSYVEGELARMARLLIATMRTPENAKNLAALEKLIADFAQKRLDRIKELESN